MKLFLKIIAGLLVLILAAAGGGLLYINEAFPKVSPAEKITIDPTAQRLARGKYLVENVVGCLGCHTQREENLFGFPTKAGPRGGGGWVLDKAMMGLPGALVTRNITPYNLKDWTDGELVRTLRTGVNQQGKALFPLMPYQHYSGLSQEDLYSIVAFIRTLKPVINDPAPTKLDFPVNFIVKTIPKDAGPYRAQPDSKNIVENGKYLVNVCSCNECHTPRDSHGNSLPGLDFAGGMEFHLPTGTVRSQNITPDQATGIGGWTKDYFVKRFRLGKAMVKARTRVKPGEFNTVMPWEEYGGMSDQDLGAIYEFLRGQVKPVKRSTEKFTVATKI